MRLVKFAIVSVISVAVLYFVIMSIQNYMQAQKEVEAAEREVKVAQQALKNVEQSLKQVDLEKRQLEHEIDQMIKEEEFYFSHGCTKKNNETFLCPPNTPKFVYKPEPKV